MTVNIVVSLTMSDLCENLSHHLTLFSPFQRVSTAIRAICAFLLNVSTSFSLKRSLGSRQDTIRNRIEYVLALALADIPKIHLSRVLLVQKQNFVLQSFTIFPCKIGFLQSMKYNSKPDCTSNSSKQWV